MRPFLLAAVTLVLSSCALPGVEEPEAPAVTVNQRYIDVALSCEYADCPEGVVKPDGPVSVVIHTPMSEEQEAALTTTLDQWNSTCEAHPLQRDGSSPTVMNFYFVPEAEMVDVLSIYVEGNVGLFTYDWNSDNVLTGMTVAIASELTGNELTHFVLEETTQAMGLVNDVDDPTSVFDGGTGRTTVYSELDRAVIALHCSEGIVPGMSETDLP
jgi:hypothetical protein